MPETKAAIITGAGSGVGRETAILLAEAGYAVTLVARTEANLQETAQRIVAAIGDQAQTLVIPADVAEPQTARRIVAETLDRFGRIDALANIAGAAPLQSIGHITPEVWRQNIDVNLSAPVLLTAAAWPTFEAQRSGVIVNVSSMSSIDPFPGFQIYAAAKVGLNMFTKCTADEGREVGVQAVAIAPGAVETAMLRQNFDETKIPADMALDPAAVAAVIRDCITGERDFDPGETIVLASP